MSERGLQNGQPDLKRGLLSGYWALQTTLNKYISLEATGIFAHRLQCRTACNTIKDHFSIVK